MVWRAGRNWEGLEGIKIFVQMRTIAKMNQFQNIKRTMLLAFFTVALIVMSSSCTSPFGQVDNAEEFLSKNEEYLMELVNLEPEGLRNPKQYIGLTCWEIGRVNGTFSVSLYENGLLIRDLELSTFFHDTSRIKSYYVKMNKIAIRSVVYYHDMIKFSLNSNKDGNRYHFILKYYRDGIPASELNKRDTKAWNEHFLIQT